jgi:hypothetical protein
MTYIYVCRDGYACERSGFGATGFVPGYRGLIGLVNVLYLALHATLCSWSELENGMWSL